MNLFRIVSSKIQIGDESFLGESNGLSWRFPTSETIFLTGEVKLVFTQSLPALSRPNMAPSLLVHQQNLSVHTV